MVCAGDFWLYLQEGFRAEGSSQMPWRIGSRVISAKEVLCGTKMHHNIAEKITNTRISWEIEKGVIRTEKYYKSCRVTLTTLSIK